MATSQPQARPLEFHRLEIELAQMIALVETNLAESIIAFERRDIVQAEKLIPADKRIDGHHQAIEVGVLNLLERHILSNDQIREAMAMIKLAADLERVGDLAKNVARRTCAISRERTGPDQAGVLRMGQMSLQRFSDAINAHTARDLVAATAVWVGDDEVDELYNSVFRELLVAMRENPDHVGSATHMVFIAKNFERIGDHATNIAENLHFLVTGDRLKENYIDSKPSADISTGRNDNSLDDHPTLHAANTLAGE